MKMTPYVRETEIETRATCIRSVKFLEEQIRTATAAHILRVSNLEARIRTCKEMINKITSELAAEGS